MEISWHVEDRAWEKARAAAEQHSPGGEYDRSMTPRYDLLFGSVQFTHAGSALFPTADGIGVSVLDLAVELSERVLERTVTPGAEDEPIEVTLLDPRVTFLFRPDDGDVVVTCDHGNAGQLRVSDKDFRDAVMSFVTELAGQIRERAPRVLEWESTQWLVR